jgi:hypothetical protein
VIPAAKAPTAVVPAATIQAVAAPARTQPAVAPATPKPNPAPAAAKPSNPPAKAKPGIDIATATGAIYKNVRVEKVDRDGFIISYTPARGGMVITKVYFDDLSAESRQKLGSNPNNK